MGISSIFGSTSAISGLTAAQETTKNGTSSTATSTTPAPQDSFQSDFANLLASVQAGDINGAQSALTQLQSVLQSSGVYSPESTSAVATASSPTGTSGTTASPTQNDLDSLFQAVQSGNITGAQTALAQLQSDASNQASGTSHAGGHHHHHHHGGGGGAPASSSSTQDSTSTSDASTTSIWSADASSAPSAGLPF